MTREPGVKPPGFQDVRKRVDERLDHIEDIQDLEFVELVATLPQQPYFEQVAVEVLLTVADYVAQARARHELELELEKLRRAQPEGKRPS